MVELLLQLLLLAVLFGLVLQLHGVVYQGTSLSQRFLLCRRSYHHCLPDHGFFVPSQDHPCGQVPVSPVGNFPICAGTAHTIQQGQDSSDQPLLQPQTSQQQQQHQNDTDMQDEYISPSCNDRHSNNGLTTDYFEYEQNQTSIIVKGRLKQNIEFWRNIGANSFVLDIIENGYKIPFYSFPPKMRLKNNNSAVSNAEFVTEAIADLLNRGLVVKCNNIPHCVNPLSVSVQSSGKKRLILDLSLVNKHIWKVSVKYEDLKVALLFLNKNDWMVKWDIHSAYHHVSMSDLHTDFLGFSWTYPSGTIFMKFVVLPFGLSTAPYVYTKLSRPLIAKWRAESKRAVMYLDDGFGCSHSKESTEIMAKSMKSDLISSGFVPKVEKSLWVPVQRLQWLGAILDSVQFTIEIPKCRIEALLSTIDDIEYAVRVSRRVHVKKVARMVGQITSMSVVLGNMSQIMTRYLSMNILSAFTWNSYIKLSVDSLEQIRFWKNNIFEINIRHLQSQSFCSKIVYSDASHSGYGGYEVQTVNGVSHGQWSLAESSQSSTWRELKAVNNVLRSFLGILANSKVKWFTDNTSVCSIVQKGSMNKDLQDIAFNIFSFCAVNCITLEIEWIPRTLNQKADYISKIIDSDDWGLSLETFHMLSLRWGPFDMDWFASEHNAKIPRFYSRFWNEGCVGVDAFTAIWGNCNGYFLPPISLISRVLKQMIMCRAYGVLVLPLWRSANFWPLLCCEDGYFIHNVTDVADLPTDKLSYVPCKNGRGIFGNTDLKFRMLALRLDFRE
ncbi:MAG: DNA N-6-adenine-methyltransferase [Candidatus Thiodiazotropha endolucinida]|nr:hypothetical protein [Candidatus Thiodiazotropha taylori]MCW4261892.1 DNA N-6-adenine-methyltransferase [Candidatus Thiodiazotropha endolucinida]